MFEKNLSAHMIEMDTEGTGNLSRGDLRSALTSCEISFSNKEMMALMSLAGEMESQQKQIPYIDFLKHAYQVLSHIAIDDKMAAR